MEEATRKRQYCAGSWLKKSSSIFVLLQSFGGESAAGMFKFNIHLITNNNNNQSNNNINVNNNEAPSVIVVVSTAEEEEQEDDCLGVLSPMKAFFNQDPDNPVPTFTNCQFTPHELVLIPDDVHIPDRSFATPCLFNLKTNTTTPLPNCLERKWEPIAAAIDKEIYVLATSAVSNSLEPRSAMWKRVKQQQPPPPDDSSKSTANAKIYPTLFGRGIVLFEDGATATCGAGAACCGVIYSYCSQFVELLAFSYTDETLNLQGSMEHDITLGPVSRVKGFQVSTITTMDVDGALFDYKSGAITKLDHNIFCVLHADAHFSIQPVLDVSGLIIQIHDDDFKSCTILKNFTCAFTRGDLLHAAHIQSCLALQLEEEKDNHPGKRPKNDLTSEKEMDCSSASMDDEEMEDKW